MLALTVIGVINAWLIVHPSRPLLVLLDLMNLPQSARLILVLTVLVNVALSVLFERVATTSVGKIMGMAIDALRSRSRVRGGKVYKAVESGMR